MSMKMRAAGLAAVAAAVAASSVVLPARAAAPMPTPTSCAGTWVTDPAGDQELNVLGLVNTGQKTPDNTDVISAFWRYVPNAAGVNELTVNVQVKKLDKTVQTGSLGTLWYVYFDIGDYTWFVNASMDSAGAVTYNYGDLGETGTGNTTQGETKGALFEGDNGIVQIVVPLDVIKPEGKSLANGHVDTKVSFRNVIPTVDRAPDGTDGAKTYKATPCAETETPTPVSPQPTPSGGGSGGSGGTGTGGGTGSAPAGPATLDLEVTAPKLSARKLKKSKRFTVKLKAGSKITGLTAKLLKGKKAVGAGKLAAVGPGAGKLKLKLARKAARKLKKGTYTLSLRGTGADGRAATGAVALRIKK